MMANSKDIRNDDLRLLGRDTDRIFKEIDVIRRKQIELAAEHINLESTKEIESLKSNEETVDSDAKRNPIHFENQEKALTSLMNKLDTLGQIMQVPKNDFRGASDLNPHTIERRLSDFQATTTAPTTPATSVINSPDSAKDKKSSTTASISIHTFDQSSSK